MLSIRKRFSRGGAREAGQTLALVAGGAAVILALVGLSIDVGQVVVARTDLQKAADAAALAGGQNLPNIATANVAASDYVDQNTNGQATAAITFSSKASANDTITVKASKKVNYTFLRVIGLKGADISATASARFGYYQGGSGLLPWGFIAGSTNTCFLGMVGGEPVFKQNQTCTLKDGAPGAGGDFGAVVLDGTGADSYRDDIVNGAKTSYVKGDKLNPQTGNMVGPTRQGAEDRFALAPPASCPGTQMTDVLKQAPDGSWSIKPGCETHPYIILIPVVDKIDNPNPSTILGFAFMWMESVKFQGGHTQVKAQFVQFVTAIPGGVYGGTPSGASTVLLVE